MARVIADEEKLELCPGEILVCEKTLDEWVPHQQQIGGLVTDRGEVAGLIVARELGVPTVCGTGDGSRRIRDGQRIKLIGYRATVEILGA